MESAQENGTKSYRVREPQGDEEEELSSESSSVSIEDRPQPQGPSAKADPKADPKADDLVLRAKETSERIDFSKFYAKEIKIAEENKEKAELERSENAFMAPGVRYRLVGDAEMSDYMLYAPDSFESIPEKDLEPILDQLDMWVVADEEGASERSQDWSVERWNAFACQKFISFWPKIACLSKNPAFLLQILDQIELYRKIRARVAAELDRQDPDYLKGLDFGYTFGGALQDTFQGVDFETGCRMTLITLHLQGVQALGDAKGGQEYFEVSFLPTDQTKTLIQRVAEELENILGQKFDDLWVRFLSKTGAETPGYPKVIGKVADLKEKTRLEVIQLVEQGALKHPIALEANRYAFLLWVLNNIAFKEEVPLAYCLQGLDESFVSHYSLLLALDCPTPQFPSQVLIDSLLDESHQGAKPYIFGLNSEETKLPVIFIHKNLSNFKKCIEEVFDIVILCRHFAQTTLEGLVAALDRHDGSFAPSDDAKSDFKAYIAWNQSEIAAILKKWEDFNRLSMNLEQTRLWNSLVNSAKAVKILKRYDNSLFVSLFRSLNHHMETYLTGLRVEASPYLSSLESWSRFRHRMAKNCPKEAVFSWERLRFKHAHLLESPQVILTFLQKIRDESQMLNNLVCFANIDAAWVALQTNLKALEHDPANLPVPENQRFMLIKGFKANHLRLPKALKKVVKGSRRFQPEYSLSASNWDFLRRLIQNAHWKVQNGLLAWFSVYVAPFAFKIKVLKLLEKLGLDKVTSRATVIQFFSGISKFYRLLQDAQYLHGFTEAYGKQEFLDTIPIDIMIDIDTVFGYSETSRSENINWDNTLFNHLHEWLNRDSKERLFGVDISKDFEMNLAGLTTGLIPTTLEKSFSISKIWVPVGNEFLREANGFFWELFGHLEDEESPLPRHFIMERGGLVRDRISFVPYAKFIQNYTNFSASGSAKNFRLPLVESTKFAELQITDPGRYNEIRAKVQQSMVDDTIKESSVSKTVCFAYSGKVLLEHFIDVYGWKYDPELSCFVKREAKKLRCVINADLISYAKQTYLHDWLKLVLPPAVSKKIYSLMSARERVLSLHRMITTRAGEKWCVPIDLKDFHHHFGRSHYKAVGRVLLTHVLQSVEDPKIRGDLEKIFTHLGDDLSKGDMTFTCISDEGNLFESQIKAQSPVYEIHRSFLEPKGTTNPLYRYTLKFRVHNGLMSGWKVTSMFGSLFNLTLNRMSESFCVAETGQFLTNLNVLGDDTHMNYRYLCGAMNHTSFINMIGKVAHPEKQLLSTVSSEFLKKKINCVTESVTYSINRMWNSILFSKTNLKTEMNQAEFIKLNLDIWNLFLSRIEDPRLRTTAGKKEFLVDFMAKSLRLEKYDAEKFLKRLLNTPSMVSGCGSGPLRNLLIDFAGEEGAMEKKVDVEYTRVDIKKNLMLYVLDTVPGHFEGVRTEVNGLMSLFQKLPTEFPEMRSKLTSQIVSEITEGVTQYFDDSAVAKDEAARQKAKGPMWELIKISKEDFPNLIFCERHPTFCPKKFMDFAFSLIEKNLENGIDFSGLVGELVVHSEAISKVVFGQLLDKNNLGVDIWPFLNGLLRMKDNKGLSKRFFKSCFEFFGEKLFLKLVSSTDYMVPFSRNYKSDELIGYLGPIVSKALYFYLFELPEFRRSEAKEEFIKKVIVTLDYYVNQHAEEIRERLKAILDRLN